ncbi:MAG: CDP-diacylglycerol--glycerol-3-phosphate 3-phosphatidyltransferase [Solirubrobacterales bacterium]|nr:CDP-diacylglycerol--glycerol-3-phosphate 3-phosphatidyltransferase [Solirubrobacterales bacterium]
MSTWGGIRTARFLAFSTSLRIVLTPVVVALLLADGTTPSTAADVAAILFCVAAATDWIDGRLARRWGVTTTLGSFLDTTADKLLVTGGLVALVAVERASPWIALIIVGRELVIMGLRGVIAAEGTVMSPSLLGKLKTTVQFLAIALAIVRPGDEVLGLFIDEWMMLLAAAVTLASAADYLARSASALRSEPGP